jgi:hypothetical protein
MRRESDCFADEVAIDFPAVNRLVAREREAFLGDAGQDAGMSDTISRQLCLSSAEAFHGAIIPLELSLRETCGSCGGRGEIWAEDCPDCGGTGDWVVPRRFGVPVPPGVTDGTLLHFRISAPLEAAVRVRVRVAITT